MEDYYRFCITKCFLKILLMSNMCQCLSITSVIFGSEEIYVTEKGIISAQIDLRGFQK